MESNRRPSRWFEYEYRCTEYEYDCPDERGRSPSRRSGLPIFETHRSALGSFSYSASRYSYSYSIDPSETTQAEAGIARCILGSLPRLRRRTPETDSGINWRTVDAAGPGSTVGGRAAHTDAGRRHAGRRHAALSALPLLLQAMWLKEHTGSGLVKWRLHTHFEVDRFVPTRIDVTPDGGGEHGEVPRIAR